MTRTDNDRRPDQLAVELTVNGTPRPLSVGPTTSLLDTLRLQLDLTGAKLVCEMGNCGACTVLLDGRPVYACLVLAAECVGHEIETVESLAGSDGMSELQAAMVDCDGLQCGFCTSGQLLSLEALRRDDRPVDRARIVEAISGNLCRCGAYPHIVAAAERVLVPDGADAPMASTR